MRCLPFSRDNGNLFHGEGDKVMSHPNKKKTEKIHDVFNCRETRTNQDPYIYKPDSIMLDLEDAVAGKPERRRQIFSVSCVKKKLTIEALRGLSALTDLTRPTGKRISASVAGGADTIRIAKTETAEDVHVRWEEHMLAAEREFGRRREAHF